MSEASALDNFKDWWKIRDHSGIGSLTAAYNDHPIFHQTMMNSNSFAGVCDMNKMKCLYVSGNIQKFSGWSEEQFIEGGVEFGLSLTHPQDTDGVLIFFEKINKYYEELPENEKRNYRDFMDYRIRRPDGTYQRVLQQTSVLQQDDDGRIHLLLLLFNNVTNLKNDRAMHLRQTNGRQNRLFEFLPQTKSVTELPQLSKRELDVFRLISQGYPRNDVAEKLGISLATVKTHCQHVFEKLNVNDSIEAINVLKLMCLF